MQTKTKKTTVYIVLLIVAALAIIGVIGYKLFAKASSEPVQEPDETLSPTLTPQVIVQEKEVEKIVEVEKAVTAELLQGGLTDLGLLVTQEYYFTEVISGSNMMKLDLDLKLFRINETIPFTESSFLASYDGFVTAGVDCAGISVEKDDVRNLITIQLPKAKILSVDVDPESFQLYDEKQGIGTRITMEDYNNALIELENNAAERATERGVLEKAEENARTLIRNFILSMLGDNTCSIRFKTEN